MYNLGVNFCAGKYLGESCLGENAVEFSIEFPVGLSLIRAILVFLVGDSSCVMI